MIRKAGVRCAVVFLAVLLLLNCMGLRPQWFNVLVSGWLTYARDILPRITVSPGPVISAGVYLIAFTVGVHFLLRWLYRETGSGEPNRATRRGPWRWRWTLSGVCVVILMFAAGTAAVGVVHQIAFLATSDQPVYSMPDYWQEADGIAILAACKETWEISREPNWNKAEWYQDEKFRNTGYMPSESVQSIIINGPDGHPSAIAVLHRDPARQAQYGVAVATAAGVRFIPPDQLPAVLQTAAGQHWPTSRPASGPYLP
jgi:hypothetical protein